MMPAKFTVLVVDDSGPFRNRLNKMLSDLSNLNPVLQASSYEQACRWLEKKDIDIALLDIGLPDKSGIELLRLIKEQYADTRVIMVTNYADDHYREVCLSSGAHRFFDKSNDFEEMVKTIAQMGDTPPDNPDTPEAKPR